MRLLEIRHIMVGDFKPMETAFATDLFVLQILPGSLYHLIMLARE